MQRQRAQVLGLEGVHLQPDKLRFLVAHNDAEAGAEELRRVEIGGQRKALEFNINVQYPVQRIHLQRAVAVLAQEVPPAFEDLQRVGLHMIEIRHVVILHPVGFIAECQHLVVAHGLQDGGQELAAGGVLFQKDAVFQLAALLQLAVERQRIQQPSFEAGAVLEFAAVSDMVGVGAFVAGDLNAEQLAHRSHVVVERTFRVVLPTGKQVVAHPLASDIAERDSLESRLVHRVYQPDILSYKLFCHNCWI